MVMKGYSTFRKAPALLEPHHQIVYCHIQDTHCGGGGSYPLQRSSRCFLQPQPTGQRNKCVAEGKNFKLLFSAGIIFGCWGFDLYFVQWEWFTQFYSDDFPELYKRPHKLSELLPNIFFEHDRPTIFLTHSSSRTD